MPVDPASKNGLSMLCPHCGAKQNTNGIRLARDRTFVERLAKFKHQTEIYLQFDGFDEQSTEVLRGESLVGDVLLPLARFIDLGNHLDLLSGRITFNRQRAKQLIGEYLSRQPCSQGGCETDSRVATQRTAQHASLPLALRSNAAEEFFERALTEDLAPEDVFRITTTSFMDAYNFDVRQLMKSCVHHLLPSGHIIPFSAYNVLYRDGHVPLPRMTNEQVLATSNL